MSTGALSPGVKRPGREPEHSPPTSAEVKKTWVYISTPPYADISEESANSTFKVLVKKWKGSNPEGFN
jgi:hypothetical protein